jgi:hypothetical protein
MLASAEKVFTIHPKILRGRFLYMSAALWFVPVFLLLVGEPFEPLLFVIFGIIWLLALGIFAWAGRAVGLVVSPEGIAYRAMGMTVHTTWDNIERIDKRIVYADGEVEGLVLREPSLQMNPIIEASTFLMKFSWRHAMAAESLNTYKTFIPLSSLQTKAWRDSEIGAEIRRYAPHLFE